MQEKQKLAEHLKTQEAGIKGQKKVLADLKALGNAWLASAHGAASG